MATIRQKKAFKKTLENGGVVSKAMSSSDYSQAMISNPQILTRSKGWKELMDQYLSDEKLARAHDELLNQTKIEYFVFPKSMQDDEIEAKVNDVGLEVINIRDGEKGRYAFYKTIDSQARKSALDMAYKLKGSYAPDKSVNLNIDVETDTHIEDLTNKLNDVYKRGGEPSNGRTPVALGTEVQDKE